MTEVVQLAENAVAMWRRDIWSHSSGGYVAVESVRRPRDGDLLKLKRGAIFEELLEFGVRFLSVGEGVSRNGWQLDSRDARECVGDHVILSADVLDVGGKLGDKGQLVLLDRWKFFASLGEGVSDRFVVSVDGAVLCLENMTKVLDRFVDGEKLSVVGWPCLRRGRSFIGNACR